MKTIVLFSGGLDSTTMLYHLISIGNELIPLSINYGQRHAERELTAAKTISRKLGLTLRELDIPVSHLLGSSPLINHNMAIPSGHYQSLVQKSTVVPARNLILLSIACGVALGCDAESVAIGAHMGDKVVYHDCRDEFISGLQDLVASTYSPIQILVPFINYTKIDIVRYAKMLEVPINITWSCYAGKEQECRVCGACVERNEAIKACESVISVF